MAHVSSWSCTVATEQIQEGRTGWLFAVCDLTKCTTAPAELNETVLMLCSSSSKQKFNLEENTTKQQIQQILTLVQHDPRRENAYAYDDDDELPETKFSLFFLLVWEYLKMLHKRQRFLEPHSSISFFASYRVLHRDLLWGDQWWQKA